MPSLDDDDLDVIARFSSGDEDALRTLISRHKESLYRFIFRYVKDRGESDDLVSQVFIRAWNNRANYRSGEARFATWLFTIATNLCRDHERKKNRHPADFAIIDNRDDSFLLQQIPAPEQYGDKETILLLQKAIDQLPHDLQTALILHTLEGHSQKDVSQILGCTVKTVETRIYRARKRLRVIIEQ